MNKLFKQILHFLGISGAGWLLDFSLYALLSLFTENLFICNMFSSFLGVSFVFIFSTRFIFKDNGNLPLTVKYIIYLIYQVFLIFLISKLLIHVNLLITDYLPFLNILNFTALLSKILITPITMICNFIFLKLLIEKY